MFSNLLDNVFDDHPVRWIMRAKQKRMIEHNRAPRKRTERTEVFLAPPAYPHASRSLLADLRSRLAVTEEQPMTFRELGRIMGQPASTTHYWFEVFKHPHIVAFMTLLERLPTSERSAFLEQYCRPLPSFEHPRLAHCPSQAASLKNLLRKPFGMTSITGGTDQERTFLMTALGHSFSRANPTGEAPSGIDIHRPLEFVPVISLNYIDPAYPPKRIRELVAMVWPRILTCNSRLLLLNRVWSFLPLGREDILRSAAQRHVIVAEPILPKPRTCGASPHGAAHAIRIASRVGTKIYLEIKEGR